MSRQPARPIELPGEGGIVLRGDARGDPGAPPVLLLHGGGQTRHAWTETAYSLADDGWQELLDQHGIQLVFVETNSVLAKFLRVDPTWQEAYRDDMGTVFIRETE